MSRLGMTYVMDIGFTSHDPDKSARIVNALADAYIDDQLNAKYQATRRASIWLQERIAELRNQATAAERAVLDFKGKNNIVDTGGGRLIGEQELAEVNSEDILHSNCLAMVPILTVPATRIETKTDAPGAAKADLSATMPPLDWLRYAVDSPFCRYAEAIRSVKIADLSGAIKSHKVIGVTSTLPNEGKSTIRQSRASHRGYRGKCHSGGC